MPGQNTGEKLIRLPRTSPPTGAVAVSFRQTAKGPPGGDDAAQGQRRHGAGHGIDGPHRRYLQPRQPRRVDQVAGNAGERLLEQRRIDVGPQACCNDGHGANVVQPDARSQRKRYDNELERAADCQAQHGPHVAADQHPHRHPDGELRLDGQQRKHDSRRQPPAAAVQGQSAGQDEQEHGRQMADADRDPHWQQGRQAQEHVDPPVPRQRRRAKEDCRTYRQARDLKHPPNVQRRRGRQPSKRGHGQRQRWRIERPLRVIAERRLKLSKILLVVEPRGFAAGDDRPGRVELQEISTAASGFRPAVQHVAFPHSHYGQRDEQCPRHVTHTPLRHANSSQEFQAAQPAPASRGNALKSRSRIAIVAPIARRDRQRHSFHASLVPTLRVGTRGIWTFPNSNVTYLY